MFLKIYNTSNLWQPCPAVNYRLRPSLLERKMSISLRRVNLQRFRNSALLLVPYTCSQLAVGRQTRRRNHRCIVFRSLPPLFLSFSSGSGVNKNPPRLTDCLPRIEWWGHGRTDGRTDRRADSLKRQTGAQKRPFGQQTTDQGTQTHALEINILASVHLREGQLSSSL